jgi:subtilisin-like proprotein convertase family protein
MVSGAGNQTSNSGRWGDYSDMTVDPVDDCTFWYTQEYYSATSSSNWNTRIGSFTFGPCPAIQKGVLTGTVTNAVTGNPIANATVVASNGFSRATNGSGVYNIDPMASGTVSLAVSAPNYQTATVSGVTVTNGSTTTQNVQLIPLSNLVAGSGNISADDCNSNLNLDPGETVTVNLSILNNGADGASTTNLVGTLQATGGVTSPSGPQNYGAVVAGQPAVSRPFTFVVDASCGGTVTATLQLQDGATNYGTRTFTFQVGILAGVFPSTGAISVIVPDGNTAGIDIPINVPDNLAISDVNVRFRADMTYDGDLNISLVHPDNTTVALAISRGGSGDDFGSGTNDCTGTATVFDDAAATTIAAGASPFAGSFKPETPLSALNGKASNGTWKLHVVDTTGEDVATVGCVTLEINKQFTCCGVDIAAGLPAYAVTAESITPANNAPDPNETVTVNFALKNNGGSNATNLVATLQAGGGVAAPSGPQSYGALASGATASRPFTFVAQGSCGGTIAATLALQDGATPLPPITINIPIGATSSSTQSFSNTTAITIPATGSGLSSGAPANPYPSSINVSGMTGTVSKITVTIPSISHTYPGDVDILLVGPGGQKYIFLSDVIDSADWVNINYTLDDTAASLIANSGTPASGTFKPTNYGFPDAFPAPAPATPYANAATAGTDTFASVFNGTNPNGTWSLYVVDDEGEDVGTMPNGWTISITTQAPACATQSCSLACPANVTVQSATPAVVNYSPATPTGACGVLNYSTPSGSTFPVGTTPVTVSGANSAQCTFNVKVVSPVLPLIISEFRLRGPGGANDEYIELYNNSDSPINVSAIDASSGWALAASDGIVRFVIPNGTTIPARSHYLAVNSNGYSLGNYPNGNGPGVSESRRQGPGAVSNDAAVVKAAGIPVSSDISFEISGPTASGDISYTADIPDNAGIALFNTANAANFTLANRLDAVGSTNESNPLYREGAGYLPLSGAIYTGGINYAFVRDLCGKGGSMTTDGACTQSGIPKDSNDNATDFVFVDSNGFNVGAGQRLGAPGPENSSAPLTRNSLIAALLDGAVGSSSAPNRVRGFAGVPNAPFGTVELRRTITNNTGANITRLRFRVIDITTFPAAATWADLRPITSADVMVLTSSGTVLVRGTTLETPPSQGAGGGFNSSLSVGTVTLATPLANGASINVRWVLGVQQTGTFRFVINVEALP